MPLRLDDLGINEEKVIRFLKERCKAEVGFYGQVPEKDKAVAATTATILLALYDAGRLSPREKKKWMGELLRFQLQKGEGKGSFCKNEGRCSVWATSWSVWAFFDLQDESIKNAKIEEALEWLLSAQNNGGWGFDKASMPRPFYTYYAYRALKAANKKLKQSRLKSSIENAIKYIVKNQISGQPGTWSNGHNADFSLADTAMALMMLAEEKKEYPALIDTDTINCGMSNLETFVQNKENWNYKWEETGTPLFYLRFFTPAVLIVLLKCGVAPFSRSCIHFVSWFRENVVKFDDEAIGWSGNIAEPSKTPYSWATALGLVALNYWLRSLSKCTQVEIVEYISELTKSQPLKKHQENIDITQLTNKLKKKERSILKMKYLIVLLVFGLTSSILYVANFPYWLSVLLSVEMPPTIVVNLLINLAGGAIIGLITYLWSRKHKRT